ncbi:MAG: trimethylamine methyltransferase family protein [Candidatus Omnitrophota bacterium]
MSEKQLHDIHKEALRVIENIGIDIPHQKTIKLLSGIKGVTVKGTRIYFKDWLVNECTIRNPYQPSGDNQFKVYTGVYCLNILDLNGKVRPATTKDLVEMVKLADSLGMGGEAPVEPTDIPPKLRQVYMAKTCWENSREIAGGYVYDTEAAEYVYEMARIVNKPFSLGGTVIISPLKVDAARLDLFFNFLDRDVPASMGNMPLLGVTAPIFYPAAYIQGIAEILGGITLIKLIFKGKGGPGIVNVYPFDMKYQTVAFGSPEKLILMLLSMQIANYFGFDIRPNALMCMAKEPDSQASAEKLAQVIVTSLHGARTFRYAGTLSQDEIFSPEQLVIDKEIVEYVSHFIKGFDFGPEKDFVKIIEEGVKEMTFLSHLATLERYKEVYWIPRLFEHESLGQWKQKGGKSIREKAKEITRKKISEHQFQLPSNIQKELDRIYRKAEENLS